MENFTPMSSLLSGVLIGLSAAAMLLLNGKIAGIACSQWHDSAIESHWFPRCYSRYLSW